jgi:predicted oxidoreductase
MSTPASRDALRAYFQVVIRDMQVRGMMRAAAGQKLSEILQAEPAKLLEQLQADLLAIGGELLVRGLLGGIDLAGGALKAKIIELVTGKGKGG